MTDSTYAVRRISEYKSRRYIKSSDALEAVGAWSGLSRQYARRVQGGLTEIDELFYRKRRRIELRIKVQHLGDVAQTAPC